MLLDKLKNLKPTLLRKLDNLDDTVVVETEINDEADDKDK